MVLKNMNQAQISRHNSEMHFFKTKIEPGGVIMVLKKFKLGSNFF